MKTPTGLWFGVALGALMLNSCRTTGRTEVIQGGGAAERTTTMREVTPQEAKRLLDAGEGYIYVDVRTPEEFQAGRPAGSVNVPVMLINPATGEKELNDGFLDAVAGHVEKDRNVVLGCRTGQRSGLAQRMMYEAGYSKTVNMLGGFAGISDETGRVVHDGWSTLSYPIDKD